MPTKSEKFEPGLVYDTRDEVWKGTLDVRIASRCSGGPEVPPDTRRAILDPKGAPLDRNLTAPERYHETQVDVVTVAGTRYTLTHSAEGYRVWHFATDSRALYADWPVLVTYGVGLRFADYAFNGLRSSPEPNRNLPTEVRELCLRYLTKE